MKPLAQWSGQAKLILTMAVVFALILAVGLLTERRGPSPSERQASQAASESARKRQLWVYEMQERVKRNLKDADSAVFRNVSLSEKSGAPVVCGEVNSKNSFGGMSGFQRFISAGEIQALEEQMGRGEMDKAWAQLCN